MITDALHDYNLRAFPSLEPPVLATPVVFGTSGSTTYTYKATFTTIDGETTAGEEVVVTTGNATLTQNNRIFLQASRVPAGTRSVKFFKKVGSVFKYLDSCTAAANGIYDDGTKTPTSAEPPSTNTSGRNEWKFLLIRPDRPLQRMDLMDMQAIKHKALRDLADTIHKNGDVVFGLSCSRTYPAWVALTDYTEGGHGYVYKYIPKDEVWIDILPRMIDMVCNLSHEIYERYLMMTKNMKYDDAHDKALIIEQKYRKKYIH